MTTQVIGIRMNDDEKKEIDNFFDAHPRLSKSACMKEYIMVGIEREKEAEKNRESILTAKE